MSISQLYRSTGPGIAFWTLGFFGLLLVSSGQSVKASQPIDPIVLKVASQLFIPADYYIKAVIDDRTDQSPVAFLVPNADSGRQLETVDLEGGAMNALERYFSGVLPRNPNLKPIVVRIKDLKIMEVLKGEGRVLVEGEVFLDFSFELDRGDELVHLLDFQGGISYKRGVRQFYLIEPVLRRSINNSLTYFNDWIEKESKNEIKLLSDVQVRIRDYREDFGDDTVFYNPIRPLTWDDFKGRPRFNNYAASIFSSISYEGNSWIEDGEVIVDLVFKTYMLKSSSWVRGTNNSYGLNHEQRHFDIAKIVMERLKERVQQLDLQPHNFDRKVSFHYLEAYREMNRLQEQYDRETAHGLNGPAQERWNEKIDEELRHFGLK
ncbi:protein of unknown function [Cyclobacterium xiamenense]|uniref:DUF922 domain-containing protein n=1 Tax=Cyclobacterium xiamenense TaxID=1297121 RepID=A0A1H6XPI8_9BACT|nr:DUF922 domain-containing protein [Cyclobacterium xiamenense]SEJ30998.1 protein of unknown function [Cyclobacterium xiamenense]